MPKTFLENKRNILGPYDEVVDALNDEMILARKGSLWGAVLRDGKVIPCQYEAIGPFYDGSAFAKKDGTWILIDTNNKRLKTYEWRGEAKPLLSLLIISTGRFDAIDNGLLGAIDKSGVLIIPCKYKYASRTLREGSSYITYKILVFEDEQNRHSLCDGYGNYLNSKPITYVGCGCLCTDRFSRQTVGGLIDLVSEDGEVMFDCWSMKEIGEPLPGQTVDMPEQCQDNYIAYHRNGVCQLYNRNGDVIIPYEASYSHFGVIPYKNSGEYLFPAEKDGKWGYLNIEGVEKIPFTYDAAYPFAHGVAVVKYANSDVLAFQQWLIDRHNNKLNKFPFSHIDSYAILNGDIYVKGERYGDKYKGVGIFDNYGNQYENWSEICPNLWEFKYVELLGLFACWPFSRIDRDSQISHLALSPSEKQEMEETYRNQEIIPSKGYALLSKRAYDCIPDYSDTVLFVNEDGPTRGLYNRSYKMILPHQFVEINYSNAIKAVIAEKNECEKYILLLM